LLKVQHAGTNELAGRVRMLHVAARPAGKAFQPVAGATAQRRRLNLRYYNRGNGTESEREVSPQRLVYHRDNWYLDAWCHLRDDLRTFALDAMRNVRVLDSKALEVPQKQLDEHYSGAYGIFSGKADFMAVLRFSPQRARWVSLEQWHPDQQGLWLENGSYELRVPYHDARELVMDILRHGSEVEVIGPPSLRDAVIARLHEAIGRYV
jgi:predicted DNA-binding transcriptional regulator YafY